MRHVNFCLAEIAAEIDVQLSLDEHVRALAQLEEREASGEPLTVVSAAELRVRLNREIEKKALSIAKAELKSFEATLAAAFAKTTDLSKKAAPADAPKGPAAEIIELAERRQAGAEPRKPAQLALSPVGSSRFGRAVGLIGGLILAVAMSVTSLENAPGRNWPSQIALMAQATVAHDSAVGD